MPGESFECEEVFEAEEAIMEMLDFRLDRIVTVHDFLVHFLRAAGMSEAEGQLAFHVADAAAVDFKFTGVLPSLLGQSIAFSPCLLSIFSRLPMVSPSPLLFLSSLLCAAASIVGLVRLSVWAEGSPDSVIWGPTLQHFTRLSLAELEPTMTQLCRIGSLEKEAQRWSQLRNFIESQTGGALKLSCSEPVGVWMSTPP